MIHQPLSPDGVHPQIPEIFSPLPCSHGLVRLFIFSKNSILSLAPLTNATLSTPAPTSFGADKQTL